MAKPNQQQPEKPGREIELLHAVILAPADGADNESGDLIRDVQWYTGASVARRDWSTGEQYMLAMSMEPGACDLSRLNSGAPVLNNHSSWDLSSVIGVVMDGTAKIENGKGTARVRFSTRPDDPELEGIKHDVRTGVLRNVSMGVTIGKLKDVTPEDSKTKSYLATNWQPQEISCVPIGADAGAGFLSQQLHLIEPRTTPSRATAQQENGMEPTEVLNADVIREQAIQTERKRQADIRAALGAARISDEAFAATLIDGGIGIDAARKSILDKLAENFAANPTQSAAGIQMTRDAQQTLALSVENALEHRVNPKIKLDAGRQFAHMSLLEMGREFLEMSTGKKVRGMSRSELAGILLRPTIGPDFQAFSAGYAGTADYPNILANVFNKTLRSAYEAEPQTFKPVGKRGTAPDFKQMNRIQIGDVGTMKQIGANGEFSYAHNGDAKEVYSLATYGQIVAINRQTLINDDLGALTRLPESVGRSAARLESDVFWSIILANAAMGDNIALFNATHANYAGSGTVISIASLGVGRQSLRKQTGLNGVGYLNLTPKYLVVPPELETIAQQFTVQTNIIVTQQSNVNPIGPTLTVIPEPRLSGGIGTLSGSTTAWYLFAEPGQIDTIEYSYLEGQEGVYMETRMGFDVDGMELKGRLDFAAKALDWRGMYKNAGA